MSNIFTVLTVKQFHHLTMAQIAQVHHLTTMHSNTSLHSKIFPFAKPVSLKVHFPKPPSYSYDDCTILPHTATKFLRTARHNSPLITTLGTDPL